MKLLTFGIAVVAAILARGGTLSLASETTAASASLLSCGPVEDWVATLPGLPTEQTLVPFYSGYLDYEVAGQTVHTHYTLIGAELDPTDSKPLIYWSNGGPGASSLFGLLTELGPYLLNENSLRTDEYRVTGIPTPLYNRYAWSKLGTLLSFDQPAPVGFSYCNSKEEDAEHPHSCGGIAWTDELTSEAAYKALLAFYDKFPCMQTKDLFLTGESYAGIYIPTLAREIVRHDNDIPLRGFAVGDGCLGTQTGICSDLWQEQRFDVWNAIFLAGHGQISMRTFREVMRACRPDVLDDHHDIDFAQLYLRGMTVGDLREGNERYRLDRLGDANEALDSDICLEAVQKMTEQAGGVYAYGLYDECTYSNGMLMEGLNDYACGGDIVMTDYLNMDVVKQALHTESTFFSVDNAEGDFDYTPTEPDLTGFYKEMNGKLRIIVYNGDTDPAINSFAAQNWTSHLNLVETEEWRPWTSDGCRKMGGYVTRYEGNFDFLTIRGAGHMVPTIKASAAFTFMKAWISGENYPAYVKNCEAPQSQFDDTPLSASPK